MSNLGVMAAARPVTAYRNTRALGATARNHSLPVYHQLGSILRQQIKDGVHVPDRALPSELQLAGEYGVSRVSVRRALEMLEAEGLILRRHGVGTFVTSRHQEHGCRQPRLSGHSDCSLVPGIDVEAELVTYRSGVLPPTSVLKHLKLPENATVLKIVCVRRADSRCVMLAEHYAPEAVAGLLPRHVLDGRSVDSILEEAGTRPGRAEQIMTAVPADDVVAAALGIGVSTPLVRFKRTLFSDADRPLLHQIIHCHPDHYEFHMTLTRDNTAGRPSWRLEG